MLGLAITFGVGLQRPVGTYTRIPPPPVAGLAAMLSARPHAIEDWWSPHLWKENIRRSNGWVASSGIAVDIDYEAEGAPFPEQREALAELATTGVLPGNLFHLTPHGARIVFMFVEPSSDKDAVLGAATAIGALVEKAIAGSGYKVDEPVLRDLARLFFTPNSIAKGVERNDPVLTMRREPYTLDEFKPIAAAPKPTPIKRIHASTDKTFDEAAAEWNYDNRRTYPRYASECPVCHDKGSFGHLPDDEARWYCFSTDHSTVGVKGEKGYHGDALDLEAFESGRKRVEVLRRDGYLAEPNYIATPTKEQTAAANGASAAAPTPEAPKPFVTLASELARAEWVRPLPPAKKSGLEPLDYAIGGLRAEGVYFLNGGTGQGKTGLACQLSGFVAKTDPVVYFTSELSRRQIIARFLAQKIEKSWLKIYELPPEGADDLENVTKSFYPNLHIIHLGKDTNIITSTLEIAERTGKAPLIVLDYIQHAARRLNPDDRRLATSALSDDLARYTTDHRGTVLALSSVARGFYKDNADKTATDFLGAAKESGDLEFDASGVFFLDTELEDDKGQRRARLHVSKSRFGGEGTTIGLRFIGSQGRFEVDPKGALTDEQNDVYQAIESGCSNAEEVGRSVNMRKTRVLEVVKILQSRKLVRVRPLEIIQQLFTGGK